MSLGLMAVDDENLPHKLMKFVRISHTEGLHLKRICKFRPSRGKIMTEAGSEGVSGRHLDDHASFNGDFSSPTINERREYRLKRDSRSG